MTTKQPRVKKEAYVCCMTCGYTDKSFVMQNSDGVLAPKSLCPKCSKTAYTCNIPGLFEFMGGVTKEIVGLKSSVFDLEAAQDPEER